MPVVLKKVPKAQLERGGAPDIAAAAGLFNVVHHHGFDAFFARGGLDKVIAQYQRRHLGDMLMLSDSEDFLFRKLREADTVFNGQHKTPPKLQEDRNLDQTVLI